jgi:hypothetical protein
MIDLSTISINELEKDLQDSIDDIQTCQRALLQGITDYSQGSVLNRLKDNKYFVDVITKELNIRKGKLNEKISS